METLDYRAVIRQALNERLEKNPSLSLRSFSRRCGISVSGLSRFLSGSRKLTLEAALKISRALEWSAEETEYILELIAIERTSNEMERSSLLKRIAESQRFASILPLEMFRIISEWHHFAIVALMDTVRFQSDPRWIAERLGLQVNDVRSALGRLLHVGLVRQEKNRLIPQNAHLETPSEVSDAAIRENHRQHLDKAKNALEEVAVELRDFTNLTFNMNSDDVVAAKKAIRSFVDQFERKFEKKPSDQVFQLNLQLYPLTKVRKK